jgi:hypothetical protein
MKKTIIILLTALLFTSCLKDEITFKYIIRVSVTDYEGNFIEDADVTLKYKKTGRNDYPYTYNNGYYEFTDLTEVGPYNIWVQGRGDIYKDNSKDATLSENKVVIVDINLKKY